MMLYGIAQPAHAALPSLSLWIICLIPRPARAYPLTPLSKGKRMTFEEFNLSPAILKAVIACGYTVPTPIQEQSIPLVMSGKDLIATAQTGTGKTAAFILPALQRLTAPSAVPGKGPRILVLTPTRELAGQVMDAARTYGRGTNLRCGSILGGMP